MDALTFTLGQAKEQKHRCKLRYRKHKKDMAALRTTFRSKVQERIAKFRKVPVESVVMQDRATARTRGAFKHIRRVLARRVRTSITTVEFTSDDGEEVECHTIPEIEKACAAEGTRRFCQAGGPFLEGSLFRDLGYRAAQSTVDTILLGTYECDEDVDETTRAFIHELRMPECIKDEQPLTGIATTTDHQDSWKKMKTTIASSPFGPLFTDYIAGAQDPSLADVDNAFAAIPS
jgi:hypothetical protein